MSIFDRWDIARFTLGVLIVACNWGVWRGVALEASLVPWDQETGRRLLLKSLALEFFFAMMLLVLDTAGSLTQKREIAELYERAATAELELAKIRAPRRIDDSHYAALVACLRAAPKGPIYVIAGLSDLDAADLAKRIYSALKDADFADPPPWNGGGKESHGNIILSWSFAGITFQVNNSNDNLPHLIAVQRCIHGLEMPMGIRINPDQPEGTFTIGVGSRI